MEGNNFEKEVRKVLEGMKISPSDHSWTNVRKRIRKKRDRRLVPFLLVLAGLFLATGGYWIWNTKNSDGPAHPGTENIGVYSHEIQPHNTTTKPNEDQSPNKNESKSFQKQKEEKISLQEKHIATNIHRQLKGKSVQAVERHKKKIESEIKEPRLNEIKSSEIALQTERSIETEELNSEAKTIHEKIPALLYEDYGNANLKTFGVVEPLSELIRLENSGMESRKEPAGDSHQALRNKRRWDFGFTFSAGISKAGNSFLESEKNSDLPGSYNTPGGSVGGGTAGYPSVPRQSFALATGVVAKKEFSKKSGISVGITYKYFTTTNTVGNRIGASAYYSYSRPQLAAFTYHNRFHFLEVPVSMNVRLTDKNKLPLYWNGGIHVAQLLATNALQSGTNNYFSDNTLFNHTYLGLGTGFYFTFFSKRKLPLNIGPFISYDLSKIADKGLYSDNHFTFLGIRSEILFSGKK